VQRLNVRDTRFLPVARWMCWFGDVPKVLGVKESTAWWLTAWGIIHTGYRKMREWASPRLPLKVPHSHALRGFSVVE